MPIMPQYRSPYGQSIAELLMRQGEIAARGAERSGQIWGNAVQNLGQIGAQAYEQHQQQKDQETRNLGISKALDNWDGKDIGSLYRATAVYTKSPQDALRLASSVAAFQELGVKQDERNQERLGITLSGIDLIPDDKFVQLYPELRAKAKAAGFDVGQFPEQPDVSLKPVLNRLGMSLRGEKPAERGPENPENVVINGKATVATPSEIARAKAQGMTVSPYESPKEPKPIARREAMDTTTGKLTFVTDAQLEAEPARFQPVRSGVNVNLQAPGGGKADPLKTVDEKWRTVIDRASLMMPGIRRPAFEAAIGRIAATGNMDELASVVKQAAVEGENVDVKNQVFGRMATIASIEDARSILTELQAKGVPTGWLSGNMEDLARRLGKTTNPEYVALGNRLAGTLINYRRAATGVQFGDKEQAQYEKMFPNYRQELPVNLALIDGLMREMRTYDKVYWENKLGKEGAKLVGALKNTPPEGAKSGPQVGERRMFNGKVGVWDGKGWVRQ